jgi:hypothetical protein
MSTVKDIKVIKDKNGMFYAKFANGGQLPAYLGGMWTHENELKAKIDYYLANRKPTTTAQRAAKKATATKRAVKKEVTN